MPASADTIRIGNQDVHPLDPSDVARAVERLRSEAIRDVPAALIATERLEKAVPDCSPARARVLALRGHVLCYANEYQAALGVLDRAFDAARESGSLEDLGNVELARVQAFARLGRLDEAQASGSAAYHALVSSGARELAGKAAANLAITHRMTGQPDRALEWFDRAAELIAQPAAQAAVQSNRAEVYRDMDRFPESMQAFERARVGFDRCGLGHAAAIVEGNQAELHARMGQIDLAIRLFESAHERFEKAAAPADAARLLAEHGDVLRHAGAHARAARIYRRALHTLRAHGLAREAALAELGLGTCLRALGHGDIAVSHLREARQRAGGTSDPALIAECTIALASASSRHDAAAAAELVRGVLPALEASPVRLALALCELSEIEPTASERWASIERAGELVRRLRLSTLEMRWHIARARLLRDTDRHGEAVSAFADAVSLGERLGAALNASQVRSSFSVSLAAACQEALQSHVRASEDHGELWRWLDRSHVDQDDATRGDAFQSDPELQTHREHLRVLYAKLGAGVWQTRDTDALRADLSHTEDLILRRLDLLDRSRPAQHAVDRSLPHLQRRLNADDLLVAFFVDRQRISALCVSASGAARVADLMSVSEARSLQRRSRLHIDSTLSGRSADAQSQRGGVLDICAQRLAAPALAAIPITRPNVWFLPVSALHGLPLGAAFAHLGAQSVIHECGRTSARASEAGPLDRPLIVGVADEHAPNIEHEARAVARHYPGATVLIGPDAGADRVLEAMRSASVVHLSTHAAFDAEFPLSSRFLCADRWVTARELAESVRAGSIVTLAGCDTARAEDGLLGSPLGLAKVVVGCGARAVIASQWAVDDASAAGVFDRIHARLASAVQEPNSCSARTVGSIISSVQSEESLAGRSWPLWAGIGVWARVA